VGEEKEGELAGNVAVARRSIAIDHQNVVPTLTPAAVRV